MRIDSHTRRACTARGLIVLVVMIVWAAAGASLAQGTQTFAEEDRDWGVAPPPGFRAKDYHAPTPTSVPGARVLKTLELKAMLEADPRPFLIDVLSGPVHRTLPGSVWLHNGGLGDYDAAEQQRFLDTIALLAGYDKSRALVFFCSGVRCWLSYNAALRTANAGYTNVYWYRGGIDAWRAAGLPTATADNFQW